MSMHFMSESFYIQRSIRTVMSYRLRWGTGPSVRVQIRILVRNALSTTTMLKSMRKLISLLGWREYSTKTEVYTKEWSKDKITVMNLTMSILALAAL